MSLDKRYELKFVLDSNELNCGLQWLYGQTHCTARYRPRAVYSLYFDNPGFQSAQANLSGAPQRIKTRLRWYRDETNHPSAPVLEVKQRDGRLGAKRQYRFECEAAPLQDLPIQDIPAAIRRALGDDSEARSLFDDALLPVLLVRYQREYYEDRAGLRVTLDRQINFHFAQAYRTLAETTSVHYPLTIMELKFPPTSKAPISRQFRQLHLRPRRHSKYLTGLAIFGLVNYL